MATAETVEATRFGELEDTIARGLATFVEVGQALMEIRDQRLYRDTHDTFDAYCEGRWGFSRQYAHLVIAETRVNQLVDERLRQSHARELAPLLDQPDQLREAWAEVVELHPQPTGLQIREAVQRRLVPPLTEEERQAENDRLERWSATMNVLDVLALFDREPVREQAARQAVLLDPSVAAIRGEVITSSRLRRVASWATLLADELERSLRAG